MECNHLCYGGIDENGNEVPICNAIDVESKGTYNMIDIARKKHFNKILICNINVEMFK